MREASILSRARLLSEENGEREYAVRAGGVLCRLRLSGEDTYLQRRFEHVHLQSLYDSGVPVPRPLEFGFMGERVYSLTEREWSAPLLAALSRMPSRKREGLGIRVGEALRRLHVYPAREGAAWHIAFGRRLDRALAALRLVGEEEEDLLSLFRERRHLLIDRPACYLHGNVGEGLRYRFFGRFQFTAPVGTVTGDPWWELALFVLQYASYPDFALAAVRAYFRYYTPKEFRLLAEVYLAEDAIVRSPLAPAAQARQAREALRRLWEWDKARELSLMG